MARRPKIAITMRLELPTDRFYLGRDYSEAIENAGGIPLHLSLIPKAEYIAEALADIDGILLPGSNTDIDPAYYQEEPRPQLGTVIPVKDDTDMMVLSEAERRNIPVLGICFGMQALNVSRGGSLIQDIESQVPGCVKHEQGAPATRVSHGLRLEAGSILSSLKSAKEQVRVNSSHHQAVKDVGRDLRATAWASDGVIEAVEDTREGRFVLGVQWHPELTASWDGLSREIFALFVEESSNRSRPRVNVVHEETVTA
ncbi:MAG: gamma-glutamyl-gamma-aminobutyrate hydrolase family protein [Acidobacteria bacterium]|nr:gamma-glutamyl-gamma-aminobutyrate hydrolase family protein [Acidobacteriota bacterium]